MAYSKQKQKIEIFAYGTTRTFTHKQLEPHSLSVGGSLLVIRGKKLVLNNNKLSLLKDNKNSYIALIWTGMTYTPFCANQSAEEPTELLNRLVFLSSQIHDKDIDLVNERYSELTGD